MQPGWYRHGPRPSDHHRGSASDHFSGCAPSIQTSFTSLNLGEPRLADAFNIRASITKLYLRFAWPVARVSLPGKLALYGLPWTGARACQARFKGRTPKASGKGSCYCKTGKSPWRREGWGEAPPPFIREAARIVSTRHDDNFWSALGSRYRSRLQLKTTARRRALPKRNL